jgi:hypothetical protein
MDLPFRLAGLPLVSVAMIDRWPSVPAPLVCTARARSRPQPYMS